MSLGSFKKINHILNIYVEVNNGSKPDNVEKN